MGADYQWMKNENGKVCAIWVRDENTAKNQQLMQQLIYTKFGLINGLGLVGQLASAKLRRNTLDARGGFFLIFDTPVDAPD